MKKYQLKYNDEIISDSDDIQHIFWMIRYNNHEKYAVHDLTLWMDGQVLAILYDLQHMRKVLD